MKVVNLNKARKARTRSDRQAHADENAIKFGRTKAQKNLEKMREAKARDALDGHKRER